MFNNLIDYIYNELKMDIDCIIPFAAISVVGKDVLNIDSKSEYSMRLMLTNVLRLIGKVASMKKKRGICTHPAQVCLPLSPNHGSFGNDGLYGESKIALETLLNKWKSEDWNDYLTIVGIVIGWTRGTGLMSGNNILAEDVEKAGVRTFSVSEMAFNILGLLHPTIVSINQTQSIYADFSGGLNDNLEKFLQSSRERINKEVALTSLIFEDSKMESNCYLNNEKVLKVHPKAKNGI